MNSAIKAGVLLAILVGVANIIFIATGPPANPMLGLVFLVVVIGLNVAVVAWGLKQSAAENGYGKQLLSSAVIGLVAGVLIFATSYALLAVAFPGYLEETRIVTTEWLEAQQMPQATLDAQIQRLEDTTVMGQASAGLIGTFFTSVIVGAIAAIFLRRK